MVKMLSTFKNLKKVTLVPGVNCLFSKEKDNMFYFFGSSHTIIMRDSIRAYGINFIILRDFIIRKRQLNMC